MTERWPAAAAILGNLIAQVRHPDPRANSAFVVPSLLVLAAAGLFGPVAAAAEKGGVFLLPVEANLMSFCSGHASTTFAASVAYTNVIVGALAVAQLLPAKADLTVPLQAVLLPWMAPSGGGLMLARVF